MARILVIEDEGDLRRILAYNLGRQGHEVLEAGQGAAGLSLARAHGPDLVLLDLMLPDLQGTDVCRLLKGDPLTRDIPVVMLTAKGEEQDRILGFELGAEDYVVKPFSVRELLLRVRALLRRSREDASGEVRAFGPLRLDAEGHRAWVGDGEVRLTAIEFRLLCTLVERRNRVQSRATLLEDVWGLQADTETRTVDTHVKRLREKLLEAGDLVETVRGVGYRFRTPEASAP